MLNPHERRVLADIEVRLADDRRLAAVFGRPPAHPVPAGEALTVGLVTLVAGAVAGALLAAVAGIVLAVAALGLAALAGDCGGGHG